MNPLLNSAGPEAGQRTFYDELGVEKKATKMVIHEAYLKSKAMYSCQNQALYSIYTPTDIKNTLEKIEAAFRVLKDEQRREAYDREISGELSAENAADNSSRSKEDYVCFEADSVAGAGVFLDTKARQELAEVFAGLEPGRGESLRRLREHAGISLESLMQETKLSDRHIKALENEDFAELPAFIYVKGFVQGYLKCLSLPSKGFIDQFTVHYKEFQNN